MTTDAEDRSTWPRNGRFILRDELLRLIEENGGPKGVDLRGAFLAGEPRAPFSPIDLSAGALAPLAQTYREANSGSNPPWMPGYGVNLSQAQLQGAELWQAQLQAADLTGAQLQGADLSDAQLQGADLWHAQFQGANLTGVHLQGANLTGAHLQGVDLRGGQLERADMYDVQSLDGACWYGAHLNNTRIKREALGEAIGDEIQANEEKTAETYHAAKEAYLLLKNNFNQIGRYEDASWAYVKERQMERMALYQEHRWWIWPLNRWMPKSWKSWRRWLLAWGTEALTKYGQGPWRPVAWAVGLAVGLFPLLFWTAGNLHYQNGASITTYWDALSYSLTTFGTLSFNDLQPVGIGTRIISAAEAFTGVMLFALLVFTLGNRMSRG